jgi:hypothetical protein
LPVPDWDSQIFAVKSGGVHMHKTLSRLLTEATIIACLLSIFTGIILKLVHFTSIYTPTFMGLTPSDFLDFGAVCFLFSIAITGRRILKHLEYSLDNLNRQI